jgi:hypothetical protein
LKNEGYPTRALDNVQVPLTALYGLAPGIAQKLVNKAANEGLEFCLDWKFVLATAGIGGLACALSVDEAHSLASLVAGELDAQWSSKSDFIVDAFSQKGEGLFDPTLSPFAARTYSSVNFVPHMTILENKGATINEASGPAVVAALTSPPGLTPLVSSAGAFEVPTNWTSTAPLSLDSQLVTQGMAAMRIGGSGRRSVKVVLDGLDTSEVGSRIGLDIYLQPQVRSHHWRSGTIRLFLESRSRHFKRVPIGSRNLAGFPRGTFSRLIFKVDSHLRKALKNQSDGLALKIEVDGDGFVTLDNFRFYQANPPSLPVNRFGQITGFEDAGVWKTGHSKTVLNFDENTEGAASLEVKTGHRHGPINLISHTFSNRDLDSIPTSISLDISIPDTAHSQAGRMRLLFHSRKCGRDWISLGEIDLDSIPKGGFQTLSFPLPEKVVSSLSGDENRDFHLGISIRGFSRSRVYRLDNLRFSTTGIGLATH